MNLKSLTSNQFLQGINCLPGLITYKDTHSIYLSANQRFATLMGYHAPTQVIGLSDYDHQTHLQDLAPKFQAFDKAVLKQNRQSNAIVIYADENKNLSAMYATKSVFYDEAKRPAGTASLTVEINIGKLQSIYESIHQYPGFYEIETNGPQSRFSPREAECLFYVLRGCTAKDISLRLRISSKTVEYYITQLKNKLNANSRAELIEHALDLGLYFSIPVRLLRDVKQLQDT